MNGNFDYFLENFGPLFDQTIPKSAQTKKFHGKLPDQLLSYWEKFGWSGFKDGLFWITDPDQYAVVVDAWLENMEGRKNDTYHAIARSAFGKIFLWGEATGQTITINPLFSQIVITPADEDMQSEPDLIVSVFFGTQTEDYLDFEDAKEKPLFKKALKKLGRLASDEMYGFEPALCIGGMPKLENLAKVKMVEHLMLLAQLGEIEVVDFTDG